MESNLTEYLCNKGEELMWYYEILKVVNGNFPVTGENNILNIPKVFGYSIFNQSVPYN